MPRGKLETPPPQDNVQSRLRSAMQKTKDFHWPISGMKAAVDSDKTSSYYEIMKDTLPATTGMPKLKISTNIQGGWGTLPDGADEFDRNSELFGAAVPAAKMYGSGLMAVKSELAISIFSEQGVIDNRRGYIRKPATQGSLVRRSTFSPAPADTHAARAERHGCPSWGRQWGGWIKKK
jgi:hypothetical protein